MIRKTLFIVSATMFVFCAVAFANKCSDVWFTASAIPYLNPESEFHIDSSYFNESGNEWTHKYIYENGKISQLRYDAKEDGEEIRISSFYSNINETELKNKGVEYIISKCDAQDTTCYQEKLYSDGEYECVETTKTTPKYISKEQEESGIHRFTEYILKQDTVIEKIHLDYNTDSVRTSQTFYVADSTEESKCYQLGEDGEIEYTIIYKPNEKGFSASIESENYFREFFFIKTEGTTAIHKTVKPVRITAKARYFDLLGRYKFTKH